MRPTVLLAACLAFAACSPYPPTRDDAYNYRVGTYEQQVPLHYARGAPTPQPEDLDVLSELRPVLARRTRLLLEVRDGPLAASRAEQVGALLGRTVEVLPSRDPGRDEAVLLVRTEGITADACRQDPVLVGRNLWTFDDYSRQALLPPGCANAVMLMRQAAAAQDLLRGRALAPGAAGPAARAAERYLRRNEGEASSPRATGREAGGTTETAESPASGAAPGGAPPAAAPAQAPR